MANKFFVGEEWLKVTLPKRVDDKDRVNYAISNFGRLLSFRKKIEDGKVIKGSICNAYKSLNVREGNRRKHYYLHRLVAEYFLEEPREDDYRVVHLDYNKMNNHYENLKWVNQKEWWAHFQANPNVKEAREKLKDRKPLVGHKLSSTDVIRIKKMIYDPDRKTRLKIIAKQFGISEMQLYRIRTGENWSHITIPEEEEYRERMKQKKLVK